MNRLIRWIPLILAVALSSVVFMNCSTGNCSSANCNGCCDTNGTCVAGDSLTQCGQKGASCAACATGQACVAKTCAVGMGGGTGGGTGGGGATGGGVATGGGATGGGTGGGSGCTAADWAMSENLAGRFTAMSGNNPPWNQALKGNMSATAGRFDFMSIELWYFGGSTMPTFPYNFPLTATDYQSCEACIVVDEGCDNMGSNCARSYLAQSGDITFTSASRIASTGRFNGTATNLTLQEWDLMNDMQVSGGRCITIANLAWDVRWPATMPDAGMDAGTDAGMDMDAGTDAGMDMDAGVDAGMDMDAGTDAGNPDAGDGG